jgi:hypothetical protein
MSDLEGAGDSGLAAMIAGLGAEAHGHRILADFLEEKLGHKDLADILRVSRDDPRNANDERGTRYSGFRWRTLDPRVLLYMAHYRVWRPYQRGQTPQHLEGRILGLYLAADAAVGPWRWVRWLPANVSCEPAERLWQELGADAPDFG